MTVKTSSQTQATIRTWEALAAWHQANAAVRRRHWKRAEDGGARRAPLTAAVARVQAAGR